MNNQDINKKIGALAIAILKHKKAYYSGHPVISDTAYDKLEQQLADLKPDHPALSSVGSDISSNLRKITHENKMLSLQKTYDIEALETWRGKHDVVGTLKIDGNSLSLIYKKGDLVVGKTRGNGAVGEDVTEKVFWVPTIPKKIASQKEQVEVRGELYCSLKQFEALSLEMAKLGLPIPTNPRNIVAGILSRKQYADLARHFSFFVFDIISDTPFKFKSEFQKNEYLSQLDFTPPEFKLLKSRSAINTFIVSTQEKMDRLDFAIDGCVFTINDLQQHAELGETTHHPRYKMVYKWAGETAQSVVQGITWTTSRTGVVTPVANIEPVDLSGASISNVSLHNALYVKSFQIKVGDIIEIIRSGEVIPKFLRVVKPSTNGNVVLPKNCPSCNNTLTDDGVRLVCAKSTNCPAQRSGKILNWIQSTEIDSLSEKRLDQMIFSGMVRGIADLYKLRMADLLKLPMTKEKMAKKIYTNIQATKRTTLEKFLTGLGLRNMGLASWSRILLVYPTLAEILALEPQQIEALDGFAEKTALQITTDLQANKELIDKLLELGVQPREKTVDVENQSLQGKMIAITGTLSQPRKSVENSIKKAGGMPTSSVSKNTFALVCNDKSSGSSKIVKANKFDVPIWNEQELYLYLSQEDS